MPNSDARTGLNIVKPSVQPEALPTAIITAPEAPPTLDTPYQELNSIPRGPLTPNAWEDREPVVHQPAQPGTSSEIQNPQSTQHPQEPLATIFSENHRPHLTQNALPQGSPAGLEGSQTGLWGAPATEVSPATDAPLPGLAVAREAPVNPVMEATPPADLSLPAELDPNPLTKSIDTQAAQDSATVVMPTHVQSELEAKINGHTSADVSVVPAATPSVRDKVRQLLPGQKGNPHSADNWGAAHSGRQQLKEAA